MVRILPLTLIILVISLVPSVIAVDLTIHQLKNSKYLIPLWEDSDQGDWVQLKDAKFTRINPEDPLFVKIVEVTLGHLLDRSGKDAAVIYGYNTGGSGFFYDALRCDQ
jgi:hypothetical protein